VKHLTSTTISLHVLFQTLIVLTFEELQNGQDKAHPNA